jgi:hypothetical protein
VVMRIGVIRASVNCRTGRAAWCRWEVGVQWGHDIIRWERAMSDSHRPVVVYVSQGPLAAEVVRSKLESEGIPAMLRYPSVGRVLGLTVDGLGRVEVLVPPVYEDVAREILAEEVPSLGDGTAGAGATPSVELA